jgi:hypothetical protein
MIRDIELCFEFRFALPFLLFDQLVRAHWNLFV